MEKCNKEQKLGNQGWKTKTRVLLTLSKEMESDLKRNGKWLLVITKDKWQG